MLPRRPFTRLRCESLEDRATPSRPLPLPVVFAGTDAGTPPLVRGYDADTGRRTIEAAVFEAGFTGGVRVAAGDLTRDGYPEVVAAAGPGGGPRVRVLDGRTGDPLPGPLADAWAFEAAFRGGVSVGAGDVTGDGTPDVVAAAGPGGGPRVVVLDGRTGEAVASFWAFDAAFPGGATVAAADLTGDGRAEVVVGAGPGGGPHVRAFDLASGTAVPLSGPLGSFYAFDASMLGGVSVGTGDVSADADADGTPDVAVGAGAGSAVAVFGGRTGAAIGRFEAFPDTTAGVRVGLAYLDDDDRADVVAATGPGVPARIRGLTATGDPLPGPLADLAPWGGAGGVFVAAENDPPPAVPQTLPLEGDFLLIDDVPGPEAPDRVTVHARVWQPDADRYRWEYTFTNVTVGSPTYPGNLADPDTHMGAVSLGGWDADVYLSSGVLAGGGWTGGTPVEGSLVWTGPPVGPGGSVTVYMDTVPVPIAYVAAHGWAKYGQEDPHAVEGVYGPGEPPDVDIVITDLNGDTVKRVGGLEVAKWEDAFEPTPTGFQLKAPTAGDNHDFIDTDVDRFNVWVYHPARWNAGVPTAEVSISTVNKPGYTQYDDPATTAELVRYPGVPPKLNGKTGWYWSDSQMLMAASRRVNIGPPAGQFPMIDDDWGVSIDAARSHVGPDEGAPAAPRIPKNGLVWLTQDRTHQIAIGGKLMASYDTGEADRGDQRVISEYSSVITEKLVELNVVLIDYGDYAGSGQAAQTRRADRLSRVEYDIWHAKEVYAQVGVEFQSTIRSVAANTIPNVDLTNGLSIINKDRGVEVNGDPLKLTEEERSLFSHVRLQNGGAVNVVYVDDFVMQSTGGPFGPPGISYPLGLLTNADAGAVDSVAVLNTAGIFTLAHEIGHVLLDVGGHYAKHSVPNFDLNRANLMVDGDYFLHRFSPYSSRRLTEAQEAKIHASNRPRTTP